MNIVAHTALFIQSKNFEVQPLGMADLTDYFLAKYGVKAEDIVEQEQMVRKSVSYENESATLFDFVMWYIKTWKFSCQHEFKRIKPTQPIPWHEKMYDFFADIESISYDYSKSILIDCESFNFKPSILVCSLISGVIEMYLKLHFDKRIVSKSSANNPVLLVELQICSWVWESIVKYLFGEDSLEMIDNFGRYQILRQQLIYRKLSADPSMFLSSIYKNRVLPYYQHNLFDITDSLDDGDIKQYFAECIAKVIKIQSKEMYTGLKK